MRVLGVMIGSLLAVLIAVLISFIVQIWGSVVLLHAGYWIGVIGFFIWFFKNHGKEFLDFMNSPLKASDVIAAWGVAVMIALLVLVSSCAKKRPEFHVVKETEVIDVYIRGGRGMVQIAAECKDGTYWYTDKMDYYHVGDRLVYKCNTRYMSDRLILISKKSK